MHVPVPVATKLLPDAAIVTPKLQVNVKLALELITQPVSTHVTVTLYVPVTVGDIDCVVAPF